MIFERLVQNICSRLTLMLALLLFFLNFSGCLYLKRDATVRSEPVSEELDEVTGEKDQIQEAYENYIMASIAMYGGFPEEAREYILKALDRDPDSPFLLRKMAHILKALKEYEAALSYALKSRDLDPEDAENLTLLADLYTLNNQEDLAIEYYKRALKGDPNSQRIRLSITTILIRKSQFIEALHHLDKLTVQNPKLVIAHYYKGRITMELGRYKEAEEAFLETLRLSKTLEPALFDLGTLYQMTDRQMDAVKTYETLLEYYPDNINVQRRILELYIQLGFKERAEEQMKKFKKFSEPGDPERQTLGLIYLKQGRLDESIEELSLIVSAWPEDTKSRYYLATAYQERENFEEAMEHFRLIKEDSKYYINAQMHIAHILDKQDKADEAVLVLRNAISMGKPKAGLFLMLASLYEDDQDIEKAIDTIREGMRTNEKNIDLMFMHGVLLDKSNDKESSIEQMRQILEIDPNHADSLNYIGYTYADQGIRLDEAEELILKALKIKPESGYIIDSLGWVYFKKEKYDEAIKYLAKAAELVPDDPTINEHLGEVYFKQKKYKESLKYYKKGLSLKHPDKEKIKAKITDLELLIKQSQ